MLVDSQGRVTQKICAFSPCNNVPQVAVQSYERSSHAAGPAVCFGNHTSPYQRHRHPKRHEERYKLGMIWNRLHLLKTQLYPLCIMRGNWCNGDHKVKNASRY